MQARRIRRLVEVHDLPGLSRFRQSGLQPFGLPGALANPIWLVGISVHGEEMQRSPGEIIVALVAWQGEIFQIRAGTNRLPIVVAQGGEETFWSAPSPKEPLYGEM